MVVNKPRPITIITTTRPNNVGNVSRLHHLKWSGGVQQWREENDEEEKVGDNKNVCCAVTTSDDRRECTNATAAATRQLINSY